MYQLDQSGKIEQTDRHTVIACVNGKSYTLLLKKVDKRLLLKVFKQTNNYRQFPYLVFASLLAILIHKGHLSGRMVIDREYIGHETFIQEKVINYLKSLNHHPLPHLEFGHVGKLSEAHQVAYQVARHHTEPTYISTSQEVFALIIGTKKDRP